MANVNQKFKIIDYGADYRELAMQVVACDMDTNKESSYKITFKDIAKAFCPEGEGKVVIVKMPQPDNQDTVDMPMKPSTFVSEMLDNIYDSEMSEEAKAPYLIAFDSTLAEILEGRDAS